MKILLTSTSEIKRDAVLSFFQDRTDELIEITSVDCSGANLPNQPIIYELNSKNSERSHSESKFSELSSKNSESSHSGYEFCEVRISYARETGNNFDDFDYVISIENVISIGPQCIDYAYVVILCQRRTEIASTLYGISNGISIDMNWMKKLIEQDIIEYQGRLHGYRKTLGEIIHDEIPEVDPKNWMNFMSDKCDRRTQIQNGLRKCFNA